MWSSSSLRPTTTSGGQQASNMVRVSTVMVTATAFTCGLLFGLVLHVDLPGVSSPVAQHTRGGQGRPRHARALLSPVDSDWDSSSTGILDAEDIPRDLLDIASELGDPRPAEDPIHVDADINKGVRKGGDGIDSKVASGHRARGRGRDHLTEQARNLLDKYKQQTVPDTDTLAGADPATEHIGPGIRRTITDHTPQLKSEKVSSDPHAYLPDEGSANNGQNDDFAVHDSGESQRTRTAGKPKIDQNKLQQDSSNTSPTKDKILATDATRQEDYTTNNKGDVSESSGTNRADKMADDIVTARQSPQLRLKDAVDGIYWSEQTEMFTPHGFTDSDRAQWQKAAQGAKIVAMKEGCGRMQNRLLVLDSGARACARYRINTDQIQGEIYSYYLSRLLEIPYVPPSVLVRADMREPRWGTVDRELVAAQWNPDKPIIMTPWLDNLTPSYIPSEFQSDDRRLQPNSTAVRTPEELAELVQWSDLIVFDYLTGNLDRVVNNMFNQQWNPQMMQSSAHNLEKDSRSGTLVFLDNESGLFHSYRLLDKYSKYHKSLLNSLCVFRRTTAENVQRLHADRNVGSRLTSLFREHETNGDSIPRIPQNNVNILQQRLADVSHQISKCRDIHGRQ